MCGSCLPAGRSAVAIPVACFLLCLLVIAEAVSTFPSDNDALLALKGNLSAGVPATWTGDPCATWQGVTCSEQGRVTSLDLASQALKGQVPAVLGSLSELTYLSLENNQLDGKIPPELGNLFKLTNLSLGNNNLTDMIPSQLGNLSSLLTLSLNNNKLTGPIPPELSKLANLSTLNLMNNKLSGYIPPQLAQLSKLRDFVVTNNELEGDVPNELGTLPILDKLYLNGNYFTGNIPPVLSNLSSLTMLILSENNLNGSIPVELGSMPSLTDLALYNNYLTGNIPPQLGNLSTLTYLALYGNTLNGTIPVELMKCSRLKTLDISSNELTGSIVKEFGSLPSLVNLALNTNGFTGPIPQELGSLPNLTNLWLYENKLSGPIPPQLGNLSRLAKLDISNNNLTGSIPPELGKLSNLGLLNLSVNSLNGSIPSTVRGLTGLTTLLLSSNRLSATTDDFAGLKATLQTIDLSDNHFTGPISGGLTSLTALSFMNLSRNSFEGPIPQFLTQLVFLTTLDLSHNNLTDPIPTDVKALSQLQHLDLAANDLRGGIPAELGSMLELQSLSLSQNQLSGEIPEELGTLKAVVDLSWNGLSGPIPSNVAWDQRSDLSGNFLNGSVPPIIANSSLALNCLILETGDYQTNGQRDSEACAQLYPGVTCRCLPPQVLGLDGLCHCVTPLQFQALFTAPDRQSLGNFTPNINSTLRQFAAAASVTNEQVKAVSFPPSSSPPSVKLNFNILPLARSSFPVDQANAIGANLSRTTNVTVPFFNKGFKLLTATASSSDNGRTVAIAVGTSAAVALLLASLIIFFLWRHRYYKSRRSKNTAGFNIPDTAVKSLPLADLKRATNNFDEASWIGKGGFGDVYRGDLEGTPVAIKKLKVGSGQGWKEFEKELTIIGSIHNRNLVKLLGYCVDGEDLLLVYEFMAKGSLEDALFKEGRTPLEWEQCKQIVVGTAQAIAYLHEGCSEKIIHRDIKPANILLDDKFEAKVSDFGLARTTSIGDTHVSTNVKGTWGYLAPEYHTTGQLTEKSDIYSFGMVMLVVITQSGLWTMMGEEAIGLRLKAFLLLQQGKELELIAPQFAGSVSLDEARRFIAVTILCIHPTPQVRPPMVKIVQMLQGDMEIPPMSMPALDRYISMERQNMDSGVSTSISMDRQNMDSGLFTSKSE